MKNRAGDWIQTYTGRCFWPLDPYPEDICVEDIAHALSMKCRYAGHTLRFYSVAEHSVLVSRHVPAQYALWGLLHDAAEAYTADIPRPLKRHLRDWARIEAGVMLAVIRRFDLVPFAEPADVKAADNAILGDERVLMGPCARSWGELPPPLGANVVGVSPARAEEMFLERFRELMARRVPESPRHDLSGTPTLDPGVSLRGLPGCSDGRRIIPLRPAQ